MMPGSKIAWDVHYASTNEDVTDAVEMGVYFYPKGQEPKHRQMLISVGSSGQNLDIPPNRSSQPGIFRAAEGGAARELPAAHAPPRQGAVARGDSPQWATVMLSHVDNFNFNWHNSYIYADDAAPLLPKGTVLKATSWHDNTAANKSNPDPDVWVDMAIARSTK
jgi:hypothetical protein